MIRRRLAIGLLAGVAMMAVAAPSASAGSEGASTAAADGDVMCFALQPYIGYCVGNVPAALLDALLP